ncbi:3-oxoacyl-[acyl-carrier-protein] reductase [Salisediminibacterium beveridgei]|uniref:3-oxoacyl-[acyl-carrier-protein] reductase n=1 Tax=Salisediminibacterium beveridgei TaxID=632773 RepID=A0A1D7QZ49_9BACI|nr:3-oxoacyl-[acyl-carrier-protein] reductase [Salisediminibacterium beveridgei]AOM84287.1 3-oxoacyl-[acyl-carrier protein] reductase [Salisediminibacterium beveridgei]
MKRLENHITIITGAGRGIGETTALKFASEGATVVVVDLNEADINHVVESIQKLEGKAIGILCNVTDREQVNNLIEKTVATYGRIDSVINNAGITADSTLVKMEEQQFDSVIDVNLKGVFNVGQRTAQVMKEQKSGVILNASSVVGLYGNFGQTNYAATKWGVIGMTKSWAKELGKHHVRVNCVAPGFIMTPMTEKMPDKVLDMMSGKSPLGRLGTPEDIANAYAFLASSEASFITGTVLSVDGGVVT